MKKIEIIKDRNIFTDLIQNGKFIKNKYYVIYYKKVSNDNSNPKFGIAVSNKLGNAVTRNKLKRQVKNIIDDNKKLFNKDYFYIIMIRKEINLINFDEKTEKLVQLMEDNNEKI